MKVRSKMCQSTIELPLLILLLAKEYPITLLEYNIFYSNSRVTLHTQ